MKCFYIITNTVKDARLEVTHEIARHLESMGCTCHIQEETEGHLERPGTNPLSIPQEVECIIVLGGDGTLLRAARDVVDLEIPLLGVNLGTLGYLAEIDLQSLHPALEQLVKGEIEIERRMMLIGNVYHKNKLIASDTALNDIVITREGALRVVSYNNYVNDVFLNSYHADGIIISTPTGSTGYSLSAGGPIISPSASLFLMTPLAPHTLNTRSIIFPENDKITVEIGEGRDGTTEHAVATFDGDTRAPMNSGDRIEIRKSEKDTMIVKISKRSFLETLRKKMSL